MSAVIAIIVVAACLGSLAMGFGRSRYRQRERRLEVKNKWSSTPGTGGNDNGPD